LTKSDWSAASRRRGVCEAAGWAALDSWRRLGLPGYHRDRAPRRAWGLRDNLSAATQPTSRSPNTSTAPSSPRRPAWVAPGVRCAITVVCRQ